ncbi:hypothetical protein FHETE_11086 [Fusarium heterosporum]|uniref:NmrA-like domain-containing protein n=1 Tax=Fusarium heterosporum TaxID=42747 RepID=A0A8H5SM67_FUSHE|nr:hypothetical protein FHETE_11086 [Fusarium heterosporum]
MGSLKKVALLGKGRLGSAVLEELDRNGFAVTVLSRNPPNTGDLPSGVVACQVDYSSQDSLVEALRGHDVAIATFASAAIMDQELIIEACIKAEVKRYIPADWGSVTTDPKARTLPINYPTVQVQELLKKKADAGLLEYTIFSVGAFLDLLLDFPFILDLKTSSIEIFDNGEHPFSCTSLHSIGKAVAGALSIPEETKNRNLFIHDTVLTQARVLAIAKKHSPPAVQWTETNVDAQQELREALESLSKDLTNFNLIFRLLRATLLSGKYRAAYPEVNNELVGVPLLTDEELEKKLAAKF